MALLRPRVPATGVVVVVARWRPQELEAVMAAQILQVATAARWPRAAQAAAPTRLVATAVRWRQPAQALVPA
jgi:hypothetical protein